MGYHWRDHSAGSTLRFNYRGVGTILPEGDRYRYAITWGTHYHTGLVRDWRKGKLWMTRWLSPIVKVPVEELLRERDYEKPHPPARIFGLTQPGGQGDSIRAPVAGLSRNS